MGQPLVEEYVFGKIVVGNKSYTHDIIITPKRIIPGWWRIEGHRLQLRDVENYLDLEVDVVVVGTGYNGLMKVDGEVVREYEKRGIKVFIATTGEAVRTYNKLVNEGRRVLAFLHLTC